MFTWLLLTLLVTGAHCQDVFREQLSILPLQDGRISSTFEFFIQSNLSQRHPSTLELPDQPQHYTLFPLTLGQIIRSYAVTELHLTLNAGKWNYDTWGYPTDPSVATGAEIWAWMPQGSGPTIDQRWRDLNNALAGLFCTSLSSLDHHHTTAPESAIYAPQGLLPQFRDGNHEHKLRHAFLPSEHVCTENLTPFLKLLPSKGVSGLASLLNPHKLFDADWHGIGVHVIWQGLQGVQLRLTVQTVMNPLRNGRSRDWSLGSLFDRTIQKPSVVAESSRIFVKLPSEPYVITPEPVVRDGLAQLDVAAPLDVKMTFPEPFMYPSAYPPAVPLSVRRVLHGTSQSHGHLSISLTNHLPNPLPISYLETMPWLLQFYLHTLKASISGTDLPNVIQNLSYIPSLPHSRPSTLSFDLVLPPNATLDLTMDVDKSFLRYTEHPPDAQRGSDLPPAVIHALGHKWYTSPLLVDPATPDFSMPYNVIIFTCSLVAFLFGSVFNLLTRRFVVVEEKKA